MHYIAIMRFKHPKNCCIIVHSFLLTKSAEWWQGKTGFKAYFIDLHEVNRETTSTSSTEVYCLSYEHEWCLNTVRTQLYPYGSSGADRVAIKNDDACTDVFSRHIVMFGNSFYRICVSELHNIPWSHIQSINNDTELCNKTIVEKTFWSNDPYSQLTFPSTEFPHFATSDSYTYFESFTYFPYMQVQVIAAILSSYMHCKVI